jgi:hypothetical protein
MAQLGLADLNKISRDVLFDDFSVKSQGEFNTENKL